MNKNVRKFIGNETSKKESSLIRKKLRKSKKNISFHHFSRRLPVTPHVFIEKKQKNILIPPPSLPMIMNDFLSENNDRKSLSRTPSFSFIQAILDMTEKVVVVSEVEVEQEENKEKEIIELAVESPEQTQHVDENRLEIINKNGDECRCCCCII